MEATPRTTTTRGAEQPRTKQRKPQYRIWITRYYDPGTFDEEGSQWAQDREGKILRFASPAEAQAWIHEEDSGTYNLRHGGYQRPSYAVHKERWHEPVLYSVSPESGVVSRREITSQNKAVRLAKEDRSFGGGSVTISGDDGSRFVSSFDREGNRFGWDPAVDALAANALLDEGGL